MLTIKNIRLIDGTGAAAEENSCVIIKDGIIDSVGKDIAIPENCSVIDGSGMTLIPGLMDAHTHFSGSSDFSKPPLALRSESNDYEESRLGFLSHGVTAVRSGGDLTPDILDYSRFTFSSQSVSPRLVCCGKMFQPYKGHPCYTVFGALERIEKQACVITDSADIEAEVFALRDSGARVIKAFYAHLNKMAYPENAPRMPKETLMRIGAAAKAAGLPLMVHVDDLSEFSDAVDCGATSIEHILGAGAEPEYLSDALAEKAAKSGVTVVPTLVSIKDCALPGAKPTWEHLCHAVKKLHSFGVPVAAGCDSGIPNVPAGESLHSELELLTCCGLSEMEAIVSATSVNAKLLGLSDAGTIEAGKRADMVLLSANPLDDIRNTRNIERVIMAGKTVYSRS